jgi:hypothetical protein
LEILTNNLELLLRFGVSLGGSLVQGAVMKHKSKLPNDMIPTITNATWGTAGAATGDVFDTVAGFAGATVASLGHKLIGKLFGK